LALRGVREDVEVGEDSDGEDREMGREGVEVVVDEGEVDVKRMKDGSEGEEDGPRVPDLARRTGDRTRDRFAIGVRRCEESCIFSFFRNSGLGEKKKNERKKKKSRKKKKNQSKKKFKRKKQNQKKKKKKKEKPMKPLSFAVFAVLLSLSLCADLTPLTGAVQSAFAALPAEEATTAVNPNGAVSMVEDDSQGEEWMRGVRDEDKEEDGDRKALFEKCVNDDVVVYKITQAFPDIGKGDGMEKCTDACSKKYHSGDSNYSHDKFLACYKCCDSYYGRAPPRKVQMEYYSCEEVKAAAEGRSPSGLSYLHDRATGEVFRAFCDNAEDEGGWTLVTDFDNARNRMITDIRKQMGEFLKQVEATMETRVEAHTSTRVYKRFERNNGEHGLDHSGNKAYFSKCKTRYVDNWASYEDWGLNRNLEYTWVLTHQESSNKGSANWRYNVMGECHRSLTTADGVNTYRANANTYFGGWNAYCGGMVTKPTFLAAGGCDPNTGFVISGPEGSYRDNAGYVTYINDLKRIKIWVRAKSQ
jgi:hypothetical protein